MKTLKFKVCMYGKKHGTIATSDWIEEPVESDTLSMLDVYFIVTGAFNNVLRKRAATIRRSADKTIEPLEIKPTEEYDNSYIEGSKLRFYVGHVDEDPSVEKQVIKTGYTLYENEDEVVELHHEVNYLCFELPDDFAWPTDDEEPNDEEEATETVEEEKEAEE